jgi:hypothetical protein
MAVRRALPPEHYLVVPGIVCLASDAELIITTGSHALSSSGAQKENRDSVSL